ncbi:hypothetical protein NOCARDAX2BIS_160067 [Nocardioides sp. AX2bis]|nr:hypothetical protein NOCARDAX2BIS_160067 [Nocardioides sp. AX2bis]
MAGPGRLPARGPDPLGRRLELHPDPPRPDHRGHRRHPGGQPDRAAPVLPAGADARRERAARDPYLLLEPAGQAAGPVHRAAGRGRGRAPRRHARPGHPALAGPARRGPAAQVGHAGAAAGQPRPGRVRARRGRDGRDHRARQAGRTPLRRRPRHARGDVTQVVPGRTRGGGDARGGTPVGSRHDP